MPTQTDHPTLSPRNPRAESLAVRGKGGARLISYSAVGIELNTAFAVASFATSAASSILQILFAGLFASDPKNPIHTYMKDRLVEGENFFWDKAKNSVSFGVDQIKEGLCELIEAQEDFAKHASIPSKDAAKEKVQQLAPEKIKEILDSTDGRARMDDINAGFDLDSGGHQRHHVIS